MGSVFVQLINNKAILQRCNIAKIALRHLYHKFVPNKDVVKFCQNSFDITEKHVTSIMKKIPRLKLVESTQFADILHTLESLNINRTDAINNPAIFLVNSTIIRNHWMVLDECGFSDISASLLIKYYLLTKTMKIEDLMNSNYLPSDLNIYNKLVECFSNLPDNLKENPKYDLIHNSSYSLDELRMIVMQLYLEWRFDIKKEKFTKMTKHYHQFRHRPLKDIEESISIATNEIKIPLHKIISYPYVMCANPRNTRKILDEVVDFNGIDARDVLRLRPGVIRTKYKSILKIREIIKRNNIPEHIQRRAYLLYTLKPETVEARINEMKNNKFYKALSASNSALLMVLYKNKVNTRLDYLNNHLNRKCAQLYHLLTSKNNFESKINKFGDTCSQMDVCHAVLGLLIPSTKQMSEKEYNKQIILIRENLSKHNNWLCVSILSIVDTINYLLQFFSQEEILDTCHIIFYSADRVKLHLSLLQDLKNKKMDKISDDELFSSDTVKSKILNNICIGSFDPMKLDNNQLLSLTLYSIEREHCFSGDGIWDSQDNASGSIS